jgi:hypothetical protein
MTEDEGFYFWTTIMAWILITSVAIYIIQDDYSITYKDLGNIICKSNGLNYEKTIADINYDNNMIDYDESSIIIKCQEKDKDDINYDNNRIDYDESSIIIKMG